MKHAVAFHRDNGGSEQAPWRLAQQPMLAYDASQAFPADSDRYVGALMVPVDVLKMYVEAVCQASFTKMHKLQCKQVLQNHLFFAVSVSVRVLCLGCACALHVLCSCQVSQQH